MTPPAAVGATTSPPADIVIQSPSSWYRPCSALPPRRLRQDRSKSLNSMVPPFLRIGMDLGVLLLLLLVMVGGPFTTTLDIARVHAWMPPAADTTANNNANNLAQSSASRLLKIAFVTGNAMKAREMEKIVEEHCYSENFMKLSSSEPVTEDGGSEDDGDDDDDMGSCALLQLDLTVLSVDLPEIQEVDTIAIAKNKALLAAQLADGPCLVEDTSLCFHALGGMPGPYIKWFHQTLKVEGLYNILAAYPDKSATAVCTLAFSPEKHADPILFTGVCRGRIVPPEPGRGFGWDSIFIPDQADRPFSQMTLEEKNALSHRGAAVRQFADWLGHNQEALLARQNKKGVLGHQGLTFSMRPLKSTTLPGNEQ